MNNEDKILEMLGQVIDEQKHMYQKIDALHQEMDSMHLGMDSMRQEMDSMRQEMNNRFDALESNIKYAWQDIALVEKRVKQHEKEYHEAV